MATSIDANGIHDLTPFGNPDGSRANLDDLMKGFVTFGSSAKWGGLSTSSSDLTARVLVGRKGSGKTVYLRRLRANAAMEDSLYTDEIQQDLPTTQAIVKYCQWFPEEVLTEQWMELWHKAILRSLVSHIICNERLSPYVTDDSKKRILKTFQGLIRPFVSEISAYSQISEIINSHHARPAIERFLSAPLWHDLETLLSDLLSSCPPICFYLDAVDEEFAHAPMYWLRCQKGLFYQAMRFLRDARLGNRLHLHICIRYIVLASVYRSEHQTRYRGEPHIRVLTWNRHSIEFFL